MDKERDQLRSLLSEFRTGMLVTTSSAGTIHARPMSVAKLDGGDVLYFATSIASGKIFDIEDDARVGVTFQSSTAYVSLSGVARVVTDRSKVDQVWSEPLRVWFPEGKDDPSLCLVELRPVEAEFWNLEGTKGLRYLFDAAKAYVTGTTPATAPDQHGKVNAAAATPTR